MDVSAWRNNFGSFLLAGENGLSDEVTHRPLGNSANDATVDGLFKEETPQRETTNGENCVRKALLKVSASLSTDKKDQFVVDGGAWEVVTIGSAKNGLKPVHLRRDERKFTNKGTSTY